MIKPRKKHPSKEIEAVIKYAEKQGWRYQESGKSSHAWGQLLCPFSGRKGCIVSIWSTPSDPSDHATELMQHVRNCPHVTDKAE